MNLLVKSLQVFAVRGFGAAAGFLMSLVVANTTDASEAGLFFFALSLTQMGGGLLTLGAPNALLKVIGADYGTSWERINRDTSVVLKWISLSSIILFTVSYWKPEWFAQVLGMPELDSLVPIIAIAMYVFALVQAFSAMLQGKQDVMLASTVQNVVTQLSFILLLGMCVYLTGEQTGHALFYIYFLSLMLAVSVAMVAWYRYDGAKFKLNSRVNPELKSTLGALFIAMLMSMCSMFAGQFATAKFLSSAEVAYFSAALRTATLASFVLIAVNLVVAPKFAQAFFNSKDNEVNKLSRLSSRLMLCLATPVLIIMLAFPEFLMGFFGDEYVMASPLLQVLAIGQFINVVTGSVGYLLNMTGHEKDMRNVVLFSGPLAVLLAYGLTQHYGLIGAAYATAISVSTQNLLAVWMVKKRLGFNTLNILRRV